MANNNESGRIATLKAAFLRDAFLKAEQAYLKDLMQRPYVSNMELNLSERKNWRELVRMAEERMDLIERGGVKPEELERVEAEIIILFAAARGFVRHRDAREKFDDKSGVREEAAGYNGDRGNSDTQAER